MAATTTVPPCLTTSPATNPMRRMLRSRSSREKDSSLDRWVRTTSPSRTVTGRPPASSSATRASAIVDLPAPDRPVRKTATPPGCALLPGRAPPPGPARRDQGVGDRRLARAGQAGEEDGDPAVLRAAHRASLAQPPRRSGGGVAEGTPAALPGGHRGPRPPPPPRHPD